MTVDDTPWEVSLVGHPSLTSLTVVLTGQRKPINSTQKHTLMMVYQGLSTHRGLALATRRSFNGRTTPKSAVFFQNKKRRGHACVIQCSGSRNGNSSVEAVCLGEGLFDMLANQYDVPREEVESWTPYAGGAPCNVSAALAKLGASAAFTSALGKDDMGDKLMEILNGRGVDSSSVQRTQEPTRDVYVTRRSDGEREFSGFGLPADQYSDCYIAADGLPMDKIKGAKILITGTLGLAYPVTAEAMNAALQGALAENTVVLVDVNWRPVFFSDPGEAARAAIAEFVKLADIVKLTDDESEWLFGIDPVSVFDKPGQVLDCLPNAKGVLITGGEKGAAYCFRSDDSNLAGRIPVFDVDVVDTTGAGDAFTAGFVYQLLKAGGLDALLQDAALLDRAVQFASACGGLTTTKPGAIEGQPSLESVIALAATQAG